MQPIIETRRAELTALCRRFHVRRLDVFGHGYLSLSGDQSSAGGVGFALLSSCECWEVVGSITRRLRPDDTRFTLEIRLAGLGFSDGRPGQAAVDDRSRVWNPAAP